MTDDVTKRGNFFDRQFLRAPDLKVEQTYHIDRRRRLNRGLLAPGVVKDPLIVEAPPNSGSLLVTGNVGDTFVTVQPGTAVDTLGEEMVVIVAQTVNFPKQANATNNLNIYIEYADQESDPGTDGITGNTRVTESPAFPVATSAPNTNKDVLLASVTLDINGKLTAQPVDSRQFATISSELSVSATDPTKVLKAGDTMTGALHLPANGLVVGTNQLVAAQGNIGIGSSTPQKPLDVAGSGGVQISQTENEEGILAPPYANEIFFEDNGQIRSLDQNHRIIFDRTNNILELREYGDVVLSPGATAGARTQTASFKANGTVGMGTATPGRRLHVNSDDWGAGAEILASGLTAGFSFSDRVANWVFGDTVPGYRWVWYSNGKIARLWTSVNGDVATIDASGNLTINGRITEDAWTAPTLQNSWVYWGGPFNQPGYFVDKLGIVHLRGLVKGGPIPSTIFTLPADCAPGGQELHAVLSNEAVGRCDILTTGAVQASMGNNSYFSLDGITFRVAPASRFSISSVVTDVSFTSLAAAAARRAGMTTKTPAKSQPKPQPKTQG